MSLGLPVSRLVATAVTLSPAAAQVLNQNSCLVVGESNVIDVASRMRTYNTLAAVAADFGTSATEYLAAQAWFSQAPQPTSLMIGRWAHGVSAGVLLGATLTASQQLLSVFTAFTAGQFKIQVDGAGSPVNVTCATMAGVTNLNGVATIINAALVTASVVATCAWNAVYGRFEFTSGTTGATSKVKPLTAGTANDISAVLGGTALAGAVEVDGIVAETLLAAVTLMDSMTQSWYGLNTDACVDAVDADRTAVAAYVQGAGNPHVYGITTSQSAALNAAATSDIGYALGQLQYTRTMVQYSSTSVYAVLAAMAKLLGVNYQGNNTTITLAFQQETGVAPEYLNASQAAALDGKRYLYFAEFNNNTAIIVNGTMAGSAYCDEITGLDWLASQVQTNVWNALYGAQTKIPQTDAGNHILNNAIAAACTQGVTNGLLAPGIWTAAGFGQLKTGDLISPGFYIYQPPVALQSTGDRAARKSVSFQVAAKFAGAIHSANIAINVVR